MLAHEGTSDPEAALNAYRAGTVRLHSPIPLPPPPKEWTHLELGSSLDRLASASRLIRKRFVNACAESALADGQIKLAEAEFLRTIALTLDCPLPPFLTPSVY